MRHSKCHSPRHRYLRLTCAGLLLAALCLVTTSVNAQPHRGRGGPPPGGPGGGKDLRTNQKNEGIAWFGTWQQGKAAAAASQRPILLLSAAPRCRGISGMW